jgi:HD-GYP domain-containing protein (c-di-GMP phosphodiesterase class II)
VVAAITAELESQPFEIVDGESIPLRCSIGTAFFPEDAQSVPDLIARADAELYQNKRASTNQNLFMNLSIGQVVDATGDKSHRATFEALEGLVLAVDAKDHYTRDHSQDVTGYALALAQKLGLSERQQQILQIAGLLHDVGKIGIPDQVLKKPGKLTAAEYEIMKRHVSLSELIVKDVPHLEEVVGAVAGHHERWDGRGYPRGLVGEANPLLGRILAVADAFSAMTLDRPYRRALAVEEAFRRLRAGAGTHFDPDLVEPFISEVAKLFGVEATPDAGLLLAA